MLAHRLKTEAKRENSLPVLRFKRMDHYQILHLLFRVVLRSMRRGGSFQPVRVFDLRILFGKPGYLVLGYPGF